MNGAMKPSVDEIRSAASALDAMPRPFQMTDVEVREAPAGSKSPGGVRFYAAVYGSLSVDMGGWRERIEPGAFDASLAEDDIRALFNHDRGKVLGRQAPDKSIATATFTSDERGVLVDIPELPNTNSARDLLESLGRKDIDGASFGFRTVNDRWDWEGTAENGLYVRTLLEARMFEGSIVTFPAYLDTIAEARSICTALAQLRTGDAALSAELRAALEQLKALVTPPAPTTVSARSDEPGDADTTWLQMARLRLRAHELTEPQISL